MGPTPQSFPRPPPLPPPAQKQKKQNQNQKQKQLSGGSLPASSPSLSSKTSSSSIAITTTPTKSKSPSTPTPQTLTKGLSSLGLSSNWKKFQETFLNSKEKEKEADGAGVQVKREERARDEEGEGKRGAKAGKKRKRGQEGEEGKRREKEGKGEKNRRRMDGEGGGTGGGGGGGGGGPSSISALAKFAEENDISPEDLSRAYGVDVVKSKKTKGLLIGTGKLTNGSSAVTATIISSSNITITATATTIPTAKPLPFNLLTTSPQPTSATLGKYLALDCEMVACGPPPPNERSQLARVSIVNYHGQLILDTFVLPLEPVTDWRTPISGVRPSDMANAIPFHEAKDQVCILLQGRILVGHAVHHDLKVLGIKHQWRDTRDTAKLDLLRNKYGNGRAPALKKLSREVLGVEIQGGEHSSVVDARACMAVYRLFKKEFEEQNVKLFGRRRVGVEAPRVVVGGGLEEQGETSKKKKKENKKGRGEEDDAVEEKEQDEEDSSDDDDDEDEDEEEGEKKGNGNGRKKRNKNKKKKRKRKYK